MERQITLGDVIAPAKVLRCDNDDYPVLSMTMHDGIVLQSNRFKKSLASIDQSNYKVVLRGQLVVGFPIDEGVIYVQNIAEAGIMSPAYGVWNIHSKEILPEYLELCLHSPQSMDYYKNKLRGTTARRRSITTGDLLALPIILPSLTEQKRRIGLFRQTTLLLNSQKQTMLKFDELVKSRFIELFVGKDYEEKSVRDVLDTAFWLMPATPEFVENGSVPYITSKNIKNRSIDFDNVKYITIESYESISSNRPTQIGDILISMIGTLGQTAVIKDARRFYGQNLYLLRLNASVVNTIFFCEFFNSDHTQHKLQAKRNQSTQAYLKANHVEDLILPLPPMEMQEQFAAFVAEVDKSKLAVKQSLEELETLNKSLMQQYFGG